MRFLIFLAVLLSFNAHGQSWEQVVESESGTIYSYDTSSIKRDGDIVTFWELVDYKVPLKSRNLLVVSSKTRVIQDCKNNRFKVAELMDYDSPRGMGKIVNVQLSGQTNWYQGESGSVNDALRERVCK